MKTVRFITLVVLVILGMLIVNNAYAGDDTVLCETKYTVKVYDERLRVIDVLPARYFIHVTAKMKGKPYVYCHYIHDGLMYEGCIRIEQIRVFDITK